MSGEAQNVKRVLFVDDSASFLSMLEKIFSVWSKGSWQVTKAEDGSKAITLMQSLRPHLVVIDIVMPGMDGVELLRVLHKRYPGIPKVILTGHPSEASKTEVLNLGAVLYLEKPASMEGMEGLFKTLDELVKSQLEGGFKGMMWHVGISEVLQIECLNRNSSVLEIVSGKIRGEVYVRDGEIIHVSAGEFKGKMALSYLLAIKSGDFNLKPFVQPPEITMSGPWEAVIMEAAQASDESDPTRIEATTQEARANEDTAFGTLVNLGDGAYEWTGRRPATALEFMEVMQRKLREVKEPLGEALQLEIFGDNFRLIAEQKPDGKIMLHVYRMA